MGEARHHTAGEGETGKPPKARDQEKRKEGKPWERGRLTEGKLLGKEREKRTGTKCDSRRGRGARAAATEKRKSEEFGRDRKRSLVPQKDTGKVP